VHLAPCAFRDPQRRSPGAATNVEQAMIWVAMAPPRGKTSRTIHLPAILVYRTSTTLISVAATTGPGTSETNGLSRFESAIRVRPDVGPAAAQDRI
jgi:hypothetical protein